MPNLEATPTPKQTTTLGTETDWELERQQIFRALNEACRPLTSQRVRTVLGLAVLGALLEDPRVAPDVILQAIERGEAETYLRFPPVGGAAA